MRLSYRAAAAGAVLALAAATARAGEPDSCKVVRFSDLGWADVAATTALTALILQDLGYSPQIAALPVAATYQALQAGELDVFLGNWMPTMAAERQPYTDAKSIDVLGPNLTGAKFTLAVTQYTYDLGIKDFADIQKFGRELDWKLYGLEPGNEGNQHVRELIGAKKFGLERFTLVEGSEQSMLAQVDRSWRARQPVVFLGWEPHPMNVRLHMQYLTGGDDTFGPNFGEASVYTNTRAGYAHDCPNVGKLLANLKFSLLGEDVMMESILLKAMAPEKAAAAWLKVNTSVLSVWLDGVTTLDGSPALPMVQAKL